MTSMWSVSWRFLKNLFCLKIHLLLIPNHWLHFKSYFERWINWVTETSVTWSVCHSKFLEGYWLKSYLVQPFSLCPWRLLLNQMYRVELGTSLVVQWLRLHTPSAGGRGLIPGRGTRSHMHAATKKPTCHN